MTIFVLLLLGAPLASAVDARADRCAREADAAREVVRAHQDEWSLGEALAFAWPRLAPWCEATPGGSLPPPAVAAQGSEVVECGLSGAGVGRIEGKVLGIALSPEPKAAGAWKPLGATTGVVEVSGQGVLFGGTQAGDAGVIRIAGVVPLPAGGSTSATCLQTTAPVAVGANKGCIGVWGGAVGGFWCWEKMRTELVTKLEPCTSQAQQVTTLGTGIKLVEADHYYAMSPNPCNGGQAKLSRDVHVASGPKLL